MGAQAGPQWRERLEQAARQAVDQLVSGFKPLRVILFGSLARGDVHEDSDVDLLVVKETDLPFFRRIDEAMAFIHVDVPVQILVYTPAELDRLVQEGRDFIATVLEEGEVVYDAAAR